MTVENLCRIKALLFLVKCRGNRCGDRVDEADHKVIDAKQPGKTFGWQIIGRGSVYPFARWQIGLGSTVGALGVERYRWKDAGNAGVFPWA